ncbi:hypothetical protein KIH27_17240 [Mycobacterium sp. M1]|uniref:Transmembrane protein n=1 Tax=Mycolicibacter acidiphilus TaxID=2835306 RepID=A0ABS5RM05_9MYCO|nr:hypothetical protein [Mycolicibacter acidiphilus]MBS9535333.1 hypothetical protein [Mycolicibacter acidiphilus]
MNAVGATVQKLTKAATRAATMTTEAAGALGGAAVNGVIGGVKGVSSGVQRGVSQGSHSTPAAALTLGALGVAGLVEWPVLVAVGGAALVLKQLGSRSTETPAVVKAPAPATPARPLAAVKPTGSAAPRRRPAAKKATAQRTGGTGSRSRTRH